LEIYPSIPKHLLEEQDPTLIHKVKLPDLPNKKSSGATIAEILAAKRSESLGKR
jgi:hypothetical protein